MKLRLSLLINVAPMLLQDGQPWPDRRCSGLFRIMHLLRGQRRGFAVPKPHIPCSTHRHSMFVMETVHTADWDGLVVGRDVRLRIEGRSIGDFKTAARFPLRPTITRNAEVIELLLDRRRSGRCRTVARIEDLNPPSSTESE